MKCERRRHGQMRWRKAEKTTVTHRFGECIVHNFHCLAFCTKHEPTHICIAKVECARAHTSSICCCSRSIVTFLFARVEMFSQQSSVCFAQSIAAATFSLSLENTHTTARFAQKSNSFAFVFLRVSSVDLR